MLRISLTALCLSTGLACTAFAAVPPEQAAQLGKELTPLGAEMGANADGSIPAWDPTMPPAPADFVPGSAIYTNPYPDEKPLYTIDGDNWQEYADLLSEGTKALLKKLGPDGFKLHVYPTKRAYEVPDWYYANTAKNAVNATLTDDGQKIEGNLPGTPFPVPQSALEVLWNHMIRYGEPAISQSNVYYVSSNGKPILASTGNVAIIFPMYEHPDEEVGENSWAKLRINYTAPARRAGEILLVHEPGADYSAGKGRKAWQYLTGQRRVRLAPAVAFDTPNPAVAGTLTYDDAFIYNGSPERFDWKIVGKKEMIVPQSNYDFLFRYKVEELLGEKFLKPQYIRWEKHRVWIIEATLKEGLRHLYSKRRYYVDEDSWTILAGEMYDGRGDLWRVQYAYGARLYDGTAGIASYGAYDLKQNIYNLNGKPIPGKYKPGVNKGDKYFTPKGMARGGIR